MTAGPEQHPTPLRAWSTPQLTELELSVTRAGASPNIQETALTDASLLGS